METGASNTEACVARDVAEHEFERFAEAMDLDFDPAGWDDDDLSSFDKAKKTLVGAIVAGRLVVDEEGQPVFSPIGGGTITFHEPNGAALMAMDQKKKGHDIGKLFATMAAMTKQSIKRFANMPNRDLKVCTAITTLFFGLIVVTPLVRHGEDERLPRDRATGAAQHVIPRVYGEMLLQICRDYRGLPDPRTLSLSEIRFFYEGLRGELKKHTRPKGK